MAPSISVPSEEIFMFGTPKRIWMIVYRLLFSLRLTAEMLAAMRPTDPNFWALLADTHLAADTAKVSRDVNMADHFNTVSKELLALPKRPAGAFVVGDLALNIGEPGDYGTFRQLVQPLRDGGLPLHLALGNHDQRDNFWTALKENKTEKRPVTDKQVLLVRTPDANWFVLDSLEKTLSTPGLLGPAQLDWLAQELDANKKKPALVLVHHNPGQVDNISGLRDTQELLAVLRPRRQVKAWIHGHTHVWKVEQDESGIHLVELRIPHGMLALMRLAMDLVQWHARLIDQITLPQPVRPDDVH